MARGGMRSTSDLQIYRQFNFGGGLDIKHSPQEIATNPKLQNRVTRADHIVYRKSGGATKRFDQDAYNTTTLGASVAITGGHFFRHSNGTDYNVCGTDDGRLVRLDTNGTTTNLVTGLTTGRRWSFAVYNDLLICCNGADAPRRYNGTAVASLGGSPPATAQKVAVHGNRVLMLDQTNRSTLTWSALNNEENYTSANDAGSVVVNRNDGSTLVDIIPAIEEAILLKGSRIYRLQGTSPSTYAITNVVPTTGSVGAISFLGGVFALNDVWWVSQRGVHSLSTVTSFGDLVEKFPSFPIDQYFTLNTDFTLSLNQLNLAVMAYDSQENRLYIAVDSNDDSQNDLLLVFDLYTRGWSVWPNQSIASMWSVRNASNGAVEIFAGGYDGFVRVLNRESSTTAFTADLRHVSNFNAPGIEKSPRHIFIYASEEGAITWNYAMALDFGQTGGAAGTFSLLGNSKTLGVNWTLGVDALGARSQVVKRLDLGGVVGEFIESRFSNGVAGNQGTIYGYEYMWRPRRLIRRGA